MRVEEAPLTSPPPSLRGRSRSTSLIFALALVTVNLSVFLPSMSGDFIWDDKYFISENPAIMGSGFLHDFWRSPFGGFSGTDENSRRLDRERQFYRPFTSLSYWLDFKIWGLNPASFHLTNIVFHTANCLLLLFLLMHIGLGPAASFMAALLFSVFPLHFENVAWISGRTDLLSFFFGAISSFFFVLYAEREKRISLFLSAGFFLAGILSKESILFLPVLFLAFLWRQRAKTREILLSSAAFSLSILIWFLLRRLAFGAVSFPLSGRSISDLLATIGFYTARLVWPFDLSVSVDSESIFGNGAYAGLGVLMAALFIASATLALNRKRRAFGLFFPCLAYFLLALPSLAVIFSSLSISLLAWRFLYFPSAVFVVVLSYVLGRRIKPRAVGFILLALLAIGYVAETYPKSRLFGRDETAFWLGVKRVEREDIFAQFNIGVNTLPRNENRALAIFDRILARTKNPLYPLVSTRIYEELAIYFAFRGDFVKAEHYFDTIVKLRGGQSVHSMLNYSYYLAFSGRRGEGERVVQELLVRYPRNHGVLTRAAKFYLIVKDYDRAKELYEKDYSLFRNEQTRRYLEELRPMLGKEDH